MTNSLTQSILVSFLRNPTKVASSLDNDEWQLLIRQARRLNLLSKVAHILERDSLFDPVPVELQYHFEGANLLAKSNRRSVSWEIQQIYNALNKHDIPFALLKGAAYVANNHNAANGRLFGDVDILVPRDRLGAAEKSLLQHGWFGTKLDPYDQKYYRKWMHELPPLKNLKRQTDLDVHHTILPPTANIKLDIEKIWKTCVPCSQHPGMYVLAPIDMVLHSAAHLFHEGEFEQGLRDLVDMDTLIREQITTDENFWDKLINRATELDLNRPLYYGLTYCKLLLETPVPLKHQKTAVKNGAPNRVIQWTMRQLFLRAMAPNYIGHTPFFGQAAKFILFVRSHYLRMPLWLLIPHLARKSFSTT